jgi:Ni/Co efflux regulator RcnB
MINGYVRLWIVSQVIFWSTKATKTLNKNRQNVKEFQEVNLWFPPRGVHYVRVEVNKLTNDIF